MMPNNSFNRHHSLSCDSISTATTMAGASDVSGRTLSAPQMASHDLPQELFSFCVNSYSNTSSSAANTTMTNSKRLLSNDRLVPVVGVLPSASPLPPYLSHRGPSSSLAANGDCQRSSSSRSRRNANHNNIINHMMAVVTRNAQHCYYDNNSTKAIHNTVLGDNAPSSTNGSSVRASSSSLLYHAPSVPAEQNIDGHSNCSNAADHCNATHYEIINPKTPPTVTLLMGMKGMGSVDGGEYAHDEDDRINRINGGASFSSSNAMASGSGSCCHRRRATPFGAVAGLSSRIFSLIYAAVIIMVATLCMLLVGCSSNDYDCSSSPVSSSSISPAYPPLSSFSSSLYQIEGTLERSGRGGGYDSQSGPTAAPVATKYIINSPLFIIAFAAAQDAYRLDAMHGKWYPESLSQVLFNDPYQYFLVDAATSPLMSLEDARGGADGVGEATGGGPSTTMLLTYDDAVATCQAIGGSLLSNFNYLHLGFLGTSDGMDGAYGVDAERALWFGLRRRRPLMDFNGSTDARSKEVYALEDGRPAMSYGAAGADAPVPMTDALLGAHFTSTEAYVTNSSTYSCYTLGFTDVAAHRPRISPVRCGGEAVVDHQEVASPTDLSATHIVNTTTIRFHKALAICQRPYVDALVHVNLPVTEVPPFAPRRVQQALMTVKVPVAPQQRWVRAPERRLASASAASRLSADDDVHPHRPRNGYNTATTQRGADATATGSVPTLSPALEVLEKDQPIDHVVNTIEVFVAPIAVATAVEASGLCARMDADLAIIPTEEFAATVVFPAVAAIHKSVPLYWKRLRNQFFFGCHFPPEATGYPQYSGMLPRFDKNYSLEATSLGTAEGVAADGSMPAATVRSLSSFTTDGLAAWETLIVNSASDSVVLSSAARERPFCMPSADRVGIRTYAAGLITSRARNVAGDAYGLLEFYWGEGLYAESRTPPSRYFVTDDVSYQSGSGSTALIDMVRTTCLPTDASCADVALSPKKRVLCTRQIMRVTAELIDGTDVIAGSTMRLRLSVSHILASYGQVVVAITVPTNYGVIISTPIVNFTAVDGIKEADVGIYVPMTVATGTSFQVQCHILYPTGAGINAAVRWVRSRKDLIDGGTMSTALSSRGLNTIRTILPYSVSFSPSSISLSQGESTTVTATLSRPSRGDFIIFGDQANPYVTSPLIDFAKGSSSFSFQIAGKAESPAPFYLNFTGISLTTQPVFGVPDSSSFNVVDARDAFDESAPQYVKDLNPSETMGVFGLNMSVLGQSTFSWSISGDNFVFDGTSDGLQGSLILSKPSSQPFTVRLTTNCTPYLSNPSRALSFPNGNSYTSSFTLLVIRRVYYREVWCSLNGIPSLSTQAAPPPLIFSIRKRSAIQIVRHPMHSFRDDGASLILKLDYYWPSMGNSLLLELRYVGANCPSGKVDWTIGSDQLTWEKEIYLPNSTGGGANANYNCTISFTIPTGSGNAFSVRRTIQNATELIQLPYWVRRRLSTEAPLASINRLGGDYVDIYPQQPAQFLVWMPSTHANVSHNFSKAFTDESLVDMYAQQQGSSFCVTVESTTQFPATRQTQRLVPIYSAYRSMFYSTFYFAPPAAGDYRFVTSACVNASWIQTVSVSTSDSWDWVSTVVYNSSSYDLGAVIVTVNPSPMLGVVFVTDEGYVSQSLPSQLVAGTVYKVYAFPTATIVWNSSYATVAIQQVGGTSFTAQVAGSSPAFPSLQYTIPTSTTDIQISVRQTITGNSMYGMPFRTGQVMITPSFTPFPTVQWMLATNSNYSGEAYRTEFCHSLTFDASADIQVNISVSPNVPSDSIQIVNGSAFAMGPSSGIRVAPVCVRIISVTTSFRLIAVPYSSAAGEGVPVTVTFTVRQRLRFLNLLPITGFSRHLLVDRWARGGVTANDGNPSTSRVTKQIQLSLSTHGEAPTSNIIPAATFSIPYNSKGGAPPTAAASFVTVSPTTPTAFTATTLQSTVQLNVNALVAGSDQGGQLAVYQVCGTNKDFITASHQNCATLLVMDPPTYSSTECVLRPDGYMPSFYGGRQVGGTSAVLPSISLFAFLNGSTAMNISDDSLAGPTSTGHEVPLGMGEGTLASFGRIGSGTRYLVDARYDSATTRVNFTTSRPMMALLGGDGGPPVTIMPVTSPMPAAGRMDPSTFFFGDVVATSNENVSAASGGGPHPHTTTCRSSAPLWVVEASQPTVGHLNTTMTVGARGDQYSYVMVSPPPWYSYQSQSNIAYTMSLSVVGVNASSVQIEPNSFSLQYNATAKALRFMQSFPAHNGASYLLIDPTTGVDINRYRFRLFSESLFGAANISLRVSFSPASPFYKDYVHYANITVLPLHTATVTYDSLQAIHGCHDFIIGNFTLSPEPANAITLGITLNDTTIPVQTDPWAISSSFTQVNFTVPTSYCGALSTRGGLGSLSTATMEPFITALVRFDTQGPNALSYSLPQSTVFTLRAPLWVRLSRVEGTFYAFEDNAVDLTVAVEHLPKPGRRLVLVFNCVDTNTLSSANCRSNVSRIVFTASDASASVGVRWAVTAVGTYRLWLTAEDWGAPEFLPVSSEMVVTAVGKKASIFSLVGRQYTHLPTGKVFNYELYNPYLESAEYIIVRLAANVSGVVSFSNISSGWTDSLTLMLTATSNLVTFSVKTLASVVVKTPIEMRFQFMYVSSTTIAQETSPSFLPLVAVPQKVVNFTTNNPYYYYGTSNENIITFAAPLPDNPRDPYIPVTTRATTATSAPLTTLLTTTAVVTTLESTTAATTPRGETTSAIATTTTTAPPQTTTGSTAATTLTTAAPTTTVAPVGPFGSVLRIEIGSVYTRTNFSGGALDTGYTVLDLWSNALVRYGAISRSDTLTDAMPFEVCWTRMEDSSTLFAFEYLDVYATTSQCIQFTAHYKASAAVSVDADWYIGDTLVVRVAVPVADLNRCKAGTTVTISTTNPSLTYTWTRNGTNFEGEVDGYIQGVVSSLIPASTTAGSKLLAWSVSGTCYNFVRPAATAFFETPYTVHSPTPVIVKGFPSILFLGEMTQFNVTIEVKAYHDNSNNQSLINIRWGGEPGSAMLEIPSGQAAVLSTVDQSNFVTHVPVLSYIVIQYTIRAQSAQRTAANWTWSVQPMRNRYIGAFTFPAEFNKGTSFIIPALQVVVQNASLAAVTGALAESPPLKSMVFVGERFCIGATRESQSYDVNYTVTMLYNTSVFAADVSTRYYNQSGVTYGEFCFTVLASSPSLQRLLFVTYQSNNLYYPLRNATLNVSGPIVVRMAGGTFSQLICGADNTRIIALTPDRPSERDTVRLQFSITSARINQTFYLQWAPGAAHTQQIRLNISCTASQEVLDVTVTQTFNSKEFTSAPGEASFGFVLRPKGTFVISDLRPVLFESQTLILSIQPTQAPVQYPLTVYFNFVGVIVEPDFIEWEVGSRVSERIELFGNIPTSASQPLLLSSQPANPEFDNSLQCFLTGSQGAAGANTTCELGVRPNVKLGVSQPELIIFVGYAQQFTLRVEECTAGAVISLSLQPFEYEDTITFSPNNLTFTCDAASPPSWPVTVSGRMNPSVADQRTQVLVISYQSVAGAAAFSFLNSLGLNVEVRSPAAILIDSSSGNSLFVGRKSNITVTLPRLPSTGSVTITATVDDATVARTGSALTYTAADGTGTSLNRTIEVELVSSSYTAGYTTIRLNITGTAATEFYFPVSTDVNIGGGGLNLLPFYMTRRMLRQMPFEVNGTETAGLRYGKFIQNISYPYTITIEQAPQFARDEITVTMTFTSSGAAATAQSYTVHFGVNVTKQTFRFRLPSGNYTIKGSVTGSQSYADVVRVNQSMISIYGKLEVTADPIIGVQYMNVGLNNIQTINVYIPQLPEPHYRVTVRPYWDATNTPSCARASADMPIMVFVYDAGAPDRVPDAARLSFYNSEVSNIKCTLYLAVNGSEEFSMTPVKIGEVQFLPLNSILTPSAPADFSLLIGSRITFIINVSSVPPVGIVYPIGPPSGTVRGVVITPAVQNITSNGVPYAVFTILSTLEGVTTIPFSCKPINIGARTMYTFEENKNLDVTIRTLSLLEPTFSSRGVVYKSITEGSTEASTALTVYVGSANSVTVNVTFPSFFKFNAPVSIVATAGTTNTTYLSAGFAHSGTAMTDAVLTLSPSTVFPFRAELLVAGTLPEGILSRREEFTVGIESSTNEYRPLSRILVTILPLYYFVLNATFSTLYSGIENSGIVTIKPNCTTWPTELQGKAVIVGLSTVCTTLSYDRTRTFTSCASQSLTISASAGGDCTLGITQLAANAVSLFTMETANVALKIVAQPEVSHQLYANGQLLGSGVGVTAEQIRTQGIAIRLFTRSGGFTNGVLVTPYNESSITIASTQPLGAYGTSSSSDQTIYTGFWRALTTAMDLELNTDGSSRYGYSDVVRDITLNSNRSIIRWAISETTQRDEITIQISALSTYTTDKDEIITIRCKSTAFLGGAVPKPNADVISFRIVADVRASQTLVKKEDAANTVFAAAAFSSVMSSHAAISSIQVLTVVTLSRCPNPTWRDGQGTMDFFMFPFRKAMPWLIFGEEDNTEELGTYAGAIVGNTMLIAFFIILHVLVILFLHGAKVFSSKSLTELLGVLKFPSLSWYPLVVMYVPTTVACVRVLLYSTAPTLKVLASFGLLLYVILVPAAAIVLTIKSYTLQFTQPQRKGLVGWLLNEGYYKHPSEPSWVGRYGDTIVPLRGEARWFFAVDILLMAVVSFTIGVAPESDSQCLVRNIFLCVVFFAVFIFFLLLQPMSRKADNFFFAVIALLQAVTVALMTSQGGSSTDGSSSSGTNSLPSSSSSSSGGSGATSSPETTAASASTVVTDFFGSTDMDVVAQNLLLAIAVLCLCRAALQWLQSLMVWSEECSSLHRVATHDAIFGNDLEGGLLQSNRGGTSNNKNKSGNSNSNNSNRNKGVDEYATSALSKGGGARRSAHNGESSNAAKGRRAKRIEQRRAVHRGERLLMHNSDEDEDGEEMLSHDGDSMLGSSSDSSSDGFGGSRHHRRRGAGGRRGRRGGGNDAADAFDREHYYEEGIGVEPLDERTEAQLRDMGDEALATVFEVDEDLITGGGGGGGGASSRRVVKRKGFQRVFDPTVLAFDSSVHGLGGGGGGGGVTFDESEHNHFGSTNSSYRAGAAVASSAYRPPRVPSYQQPQGYQHGNNGIRHSASTSAQPPRPPMLEVDHHNYGESEEPVGNLGGWEHAFFSNDTNTVWM